MYDIKIIATGNENTRISFDHVGKKFILGVPDEIIAEAENRGIDTKFFTAHAPAFYDHASLADLEKSTGIHGLEEVVVESSVKTARSFMTKIENAIKVNGNVPTNGLNYGVSDITEGVDVIIGLHDSSYFTMMTMNEAYKTLRANGEPLLSDENLENMPQPGEQNLGFFFNSIGLNASVVAGDDYIVGIRPNGQRHVAMNEGLGRKPGSFASLDSWHKRGMKNELGIEDATLETVSLREVFLVPSLGQMGVHVLNKIPESAETLRASHQTARDGWENQRLIAVSFTAEELQALADSEEPTVDYTRGLWHNLAQTYEF